jgi:hypothetical protein
MKQPIAPAPKPKPPAAPKPPPEVKKVVQPPQEIKKVEPPKRDLPITCNTFLSKDLQKESVFEEDAALIEEMLLEDDSRRLARQI